MSTPESAIPICDTCELNDVGLDSAACVALRAQAAKVYYQDLIMDSDVSETLAGAGADPEAARAANTCLEQIYRANCAAAMIGWVDGEQDIVPRT